MMLSLKCGIWFESKVMLTPPPWVELAARRCFADVKFSASHSFSPLFVCVEWFLTFLHTLSLARRVLIAGWMDYSMWAEKNFVPSFEVWIPRSQSAEEVVHVVIFGRFFLKKKKCAKPCFGFLRPQGFWHFARVFGGAFGTSEPPPPHSEPYP